MQKKVMVRTPIITLIIVICVIVCKCATDIDKLTTNRTESLTYCTVDDIRNIDELYKLDDQQNVSVNFIIYHCNLSIVPNTLFTHSLNIQSLDFFDANITSIENYAFNGLHQLQFLRINANANFTRFQSWSVHNLDKLQVLDLQRNGIRELDAFALHRYPHLVHLNLANNFIDDIPVGFFDCSIHVESLDLDENRISRIESYTLKTLLRLVDLNLQSNRIEYIDPYAFTTTSHLKSLRLNNNRIASLNSMLFFNLPWLEYLSLSENALQGYLIEDNTFHQNLSLKVLDISHNSFTGFHNGAFKGLTSLEVFNVSHNLLFSIQSSALKYFGNLKSLDISNNSLTHLMDNLFTYLASIEHINASGNAIRFIQPFTFTDLPTLRTLDLSKNQLETEAFLEQIVDMNVINLSNNCYQTLNFTLFVGIKNVNLVGNPWNCSWLISELVEKQNEIMQIHLGNEWNGIEYEELVQRKPEELVCFDHRNASDGNLDSPIRREVIIVNTGNRINKDMEAEKKKIAAINTYPRTFSKLLSKEFDYKACLLWAVIAVFVVVGLIRMGKYFLERSERKSERYRITQQEKVLKDIDEYFAKNNAQNKERA